MDYYRNKHFPSELSINRYSSTSQINPLALFDKLLQYLREKYSERLESLQNASNDFKKEVNFDAVIEVMRQSPITEKFLDIRISEIFSNVLLEENEKTISGLQTELGLKQAEILKLSGQIQVKSENQGNFFNQCHNISHSNQANQNFGNFQNTGRLEESSFHYQNRDKGEIERLQEENAYLKKELGKTREVCTENEKLQRYCEQLEAEREKINGSEYKEMGKMIEAHKVAGIETLKEAQNRFKKKSKLLKKKIIEQKATIENLNDKINDLAKRRPKEELSQSDHLKKEYERREAEIIEKYKQQIVSLQYQYQHLLENKVKEIESMINPKLKPTENTQSLQIVINQLESQNDYLKSQVNSASGLRAKTEELELKNTELESSLLALRSQLELKALLHEETKIKLKKLEAKFSDLEKAHKALEVQAKPPPSPSPFHPSSKHPSIDTFKLKKLQNHVFLFKSQLSSLKNHLAESLISMKSEQHRKLIELIRKIEKCSDQKSRNLLQENQKLSTLLKNNSEAFDKLQEEVRSEYAKIKLKSQEKLIEALKEFKSKHDKEFQEIKNENKKLHELMEKANSTFMIDSHLNRQLKDEVDSLRAEKETIRAKQVMLEEKFQTQSNNFRNQLRSKQSEVDSLRKSFNFNSS